MARGKGRERRRGAAHRHLSPVKHSVSARHMGTGSPRPPLTLLSRDPSPGALARERASGGVREGHKVRASATARVRGHSRQRATCLGEGNTCERDERAKRERSGRPPSVRLRREAAGGRRRPPLGMAVPRKAIAPRVRDCASPQKRIRAPPLAMSDPVCTAA